MEITKEEVLDYHRFPVPGKNSSYKGFDG